MRQGIPYKPFTGAEVFPETAGTPLGDVLDAVEFVAQLTAFHQGFKIGKPLQGKITEKFLMDKIKYL